MELELIRRYFINGCNGELFNNGQRVCYTIELPWLENKPRVSCIPEGKYDVIKRYSKKYGNHLLIKNVKGRDLILIHPANDAKKELKGCIAPVSILTAEGKGLRSRIAFDKIKAIVYPEFEKGNKVCLIIKSVHNEIE